MWARHVRRSFPSLLTFSGLPRIRLIPYHLIPPHLIPGHYAAETSSRLARGSVDSNNSHWSQQRQTARVGTPRSGKLTRPTGFAAELVGFTYSPCVLYRSTGYITHRHNSAPRYQFPLYLTTRPVYYCQVILAAMASCKNPRDGMAADPPSIAAWY